MLAHAGKRLTTRITVHVQEKLQAAADIVGTTLSQFVVQAALEKAERVIESESSILLTRITPGWVFCRPSRISTT